MENNWEKWKKMENNWKKMENNWEKLKKIEKKMENNWEKWMTIGNGFFCIFQHSLPVFFSRRFWAAIIPTTGTLAPSEWWSVTRSHMDLMIEVGFLVHFMKHDGNWRNWQGNFGDWHQNFLVFLLAIAILVHYRYWYSPSCRSCGLLTQPLDCFKTHVEQDT